MMNCLIDDFIDAGADILTLHVETTAPQGPQNAIDLGNLASPFETVSVTE